jgi:rsbT co-antagonist protein RsbR
MSSNPLSSARALDLLTVLRTDGSIESAAPGFAEALGLERSALAGRSIFELAPEQDRDALQDAWRALRPGGVPSVFEVRMTCEGPALRWFAWQAVLDEEAGLVLSVVRHAPEIDERQRVQRRELLLSTIAKNAPLLAWVADAEGKLLDVVGRGPEPIGAPERVSAGARINEVFAAAPEMLAAIRRGLNGTGSFERYPVGYEMLDTWLVPVTSEDGREALVGVSVDATGEAARARLQEEFIRMQELRRGLATPVLPLWEGVLCVPLTGILDSARCEALMENVLKVIPLQQAHHLILDLTGMEVVDTEVANHLFLISQASRLLGARPIITGVRSDVAKSWVSLGIGWPDLLTLPTLKDGLRTSIRYAQAKRAKS